MIITNLDFSVFCKTFQGQLDIVKGIGFTEGGLVDVLLDGEEYQWRVIRNAIGGVTIWCAFTGVGELGPWKKVGFLEAPEFGEIRIC